MCDQWQTKLQKSLSLSLELRDPPSLLTQLDGPWKVAKLWQTSSHDTRTLHVGSSQSSPVRLLLYVSRVLFSFRHIFFYYFVFFFNFLPRQTELISTAWITRHYHRLLSHPGMDWTWPPWQQQPAAIAEMSGCHGYPACTVFIPQLFPPNRNGNDSAHIFNPAINPYMSGKEEYQTDRLLVSASCFRFGSVTSAANERTRIFIPSQVTGLIA